MTLSNPIAQVDLSQIVPYSGATQNVDLGVYSIYQVKVYVGGSSGPFLDSSSGTIRARTNNGLSDAPFSAEAITASGTINASTTLTGHRLGYLGFNDSVTLGWPGTSYGSFQAGMQGSVITGVGSVVSPSLRFGTDTNSGIYQPAANQMGFVAAGTEMFRIATGNLIYSFGTHQFNSMITFGGTTSSYPALKRSGTGLQVRLADDSADAPITASQFNWITADGTTRKRLMDAAALGIDFQANEATNPLFRFTYAGTEYPLVIDRTGITVTGNVTASGNVNFSGSGQKICFLSSNTSTGTLDFYRTGDISPLMQLNQYGTGTNARFVAVRGEGLYAKSDAGVDQANVGQYGVRVASGVGFQFSSSASSTSGIDAGVFRYAANAICVGNGTAGNATGNVYAGGFRAQQGNGIVGTLWINNSNDTWSAFQFPASQNALTFSPGVSGGLFRFEGTTSSYSALKRSGQGVHVKLGDDSAFGDLHARNIEAQSTGYFGWTNGALLKSPSDGVIDIRNWADNAYGAIKSGAISLTADPTAGVDLSSGAGAIFKNTTSGVVSFRYNDGGTIKSVPLT